VSSTRPSWLDYFLILAGMASSLLLTEWSGFQAVETAQTPELVRKLLLRHLPALLFLPLGILLFWPVFYGTQRLAGRPQHLTAGEWLWGVAWLGAVAFIAWIVWQYWGTPPEPLRPASFKQHVFVGYAVGVLALAALGILIGIINLIGRWSQPWTHTFSLVLTTWPIVPLAALWLWKVEMR
jgi:hypothetical protein